MVNVRTQSDRRNHNNRRRFSHPGRLDGHFAADRASGRKGTRRNYQQAQGLHLQKGRLPYPNLSIVGGGLVLQYCRRKSSRKVLPK